MSGAEAASERVSCRLIIRGETKEVVRVGRTLSDVQGQGGVWLPRSRIDIVEIEASGDGGRWRRIFMPKGLAEKYGFYVETDVERAEVRVAANWRPGGNRESGS